MCLSKRHTTLTNKTTKYILSFFNKSMPTQIQAWTLYQETLILSICINISKQPI